MKNEILRLMKESGTYISGQRLCDEFKVSRTSIWKMMEQLKREGYAIEAVRNRGYRLISSPDVLSEAEISSLLNTEWAGKKIVYFSETDSTNNRAKEFGEKDGERLSPRTRSVPEKAGEDGRGALRREKASI